MQTRMLLPNRDGDVRWGYLDRFDFNPYLARAFALSASLALAATLLQRAWPQRVAPPPRMTIDVPIDLIWSPSVQPLPAPAPVPRIAPAPRVTVARWRPVDEVIEPVAIDSPVSAAAASTAAPNTDATGIDDAIAVPGASLETSVWPDPDTFIPVEQQPLLISMPTPAYPELASDAGIEGTVLVRVLVGADGFVHRAQIVQSVLGLDEAALAAAQDAVFRPARQQERPVAVWALIPIEFRLRD